jgi:hypothetical protein
MMMSSIQNSLNQALTRYAKIGMTQNLVDAYDNYRGTSSVDVGQAPVNDSVAGDNVSSDTAAATINKQMSKVLEKRRKMYDETLAVYLKDLQDDGKVNGAGKSVSGASLKALGLQELTTLKDVDADKAQAFAQGYYDKLTAIQRSFADKATREKIQKGDWTTVASNITIDHDNNGRGGGYGNDIMQGYAQMKRTFVQSYKQLVADGVIKDEGNALKEGMTDADGNAKPLALNTLNLALDYSKFTIPDVADASVKNDAVGAAKISRLASLKTMMEDYQTRVNALDLADNMTIDSFVAADGTKKGEITGEADGYNDQIAKAFSDKSTAFIDFARTANQLIQAEKTPLATGSDFSRFDALLDDNGFSDSLKTAYSGSTIKAGGQYGVTGKVETTDTSGTTTTVQRDDNMSIAERRQVSLDEIKPILMRTIDDYSSKGSALPIAFPDEEKRFSIQVPDGEDVITNEKDGEPIVGKFVDTDGKSLPVVYTKAGSKVFARFYRKETFKNGVTILTTGVVEVDAKKALPDGKKPSDILTTDMFVADDDKRKVVDYYTRRIESNGSTDNKKVFYVARNFADNTDRFKAIKAARKAAEMGTLDESEIDKASKKKTDVGDATVDTSEVDDVLN